MKSPAFSFYVRDWLCSQTVSKLHSKALSKDGSNRCSRCLNAYMFLLCHAWLQEPQGSLPDDDDVLCELARVTPEEWREIKVLVLPQFPIGPDHRRRNDRQNEEVARQRYRKQNGSKGGSKTAANRVANAVANHVAALEDEDEDENEDLKALRSKRSSYLKLKALSVGETTSGDLKSCLLEVESGPEPAAMTAMKNIVGAQVMEPSDPAGDNYRSGDGGKWRLRLRQNRAKTHRVLATLVEEILEGKVKNRGARAEMLWQEFTS